MDSCLSLIHIFTVGSIIVISLAFHKLFPTIFFLVFFLELRKRTGGYHLDKFYICYLATVVSYLVIVIISARLSEDCLLYTSYHLYIFEIEMPEMNGLQLAKEIRKIDAKALFVFLTVSYTHLDVYKRQVLGKFVDLKVVLNL